MAQLWKLPALGRDATSGLPIGVLLTGARFREDLCLDAAQVIEARFDLETPIDPAARP
jgi:amidase